AILLVADVAFMKGEARPLLGADEFAHLVQVLLVAGGEVVQADHALVELEQGFEQVGADEAGDAGDQPGFRAGPEIFLKLFVAGSHRLHFPCRYVNENARRQRRTSTSCLSKIALRSYSTWASFLPKL